jgi:U4/U6 small nuclear ribonucleoprotein PRP3
MASVNKRPAPVSFEEQLAEAKKRAAQAKARIEAVQNKQNGVANASATPSAPKSAAELAREKLEAIKARVAAATAKSQSLQPPSRAPPAAVRETRPPEPEDRTIGSNGAGRGGLAIGIHPRLLGDLGDPKKAPPPKAKVQKEEPKEKTNPYLSEVGPSGRAKRNLNFTHNLHSRPAMEAANAMRRKARLDEMKQRIQQAASKAGVEETTDIQVFAVSEPPVVEWWDEDLQSKIDGNEHITNLVLHPIPIEAAQDKYITLKPQALMLTTKEQKKMRRIRRMKEHKDQQAMIRLGLVPPPEPKITHKNVMKVYGELAVKDPTKVEQMVKVQIEDRKDKHEAENAARQLTDEQRKEKQKRKAKENAAMGLTTSVYKVNLTKDQLLGKHRYKIDVNAKQMLDVTGLALVAPSFTICVVEAGQHSTRKYQKLMLDRIPWKALLDGNGEILNHDEDKDPDERDTTCTLLWQGQVRDRKFKKWGSLREVETDIQAKEVLTKAKMENFWTLAKSTVVS